jgi:hypothetical protein
MFVRRLLAVLGAGLVLAVCALGQARAGEPEWLKVATPRYTVLSQWDEPRTLAWVREYDRYIDSVATLLHVDTTALPPLTIVIFAHQRDFAPYLPDRSDSAEAPRQKAYFTRRETWAIAGLAGDPGDENDSRLLMFHEGLHWLTSLDYPIRFPPWLDEGLAQLFSTARAQGGSLQWGAPDPAMLQFLRRAELLPLDKVLTASRSDELFDSGAHTGAFYAQSWALVHYLLLGQRAQAPGIDAALLQQLRERRPDSLLQDVFAASRSDTEALLRNYLRQRRFATATLTTDAVGTAVEVSTASEAEVEAARGQLALTTGHRRLALRHARRAVALGPDLPAGHELLAVHAAWDPRTRESSAAHARRALERGSRDAEMPLLMGDALGDHDDAADPAVARRRADLYLRALALRPRMLQAYERLAWALNDVGTTTAQDAQILERGHAVFATAAGPLLGLTILAHRRSDPEGERQLMAATLAAEDGLSSMSLQRLQALQSRWRYAETERRVAVLLAAGQQREAIAAVDALLPQLTETALRNAAMNWHAGLVIGERLRTAESALKGGHRAEAREIYEQLDARTDLSGDLRQWLVLALERTSRR